MPDDPTTPMDPATARVILLGLQEGVNPFTGEPLPDAAACQDPDVQAALDLAVRLLDGKPPRPSKPAKPAEPPDEPTLF